MVDLQVAELDALNKATSALDAGIKALLDQGWNLDNFRFGTLQDGRVGVNITLAIGEAKKIRTGGWADY